MTATSSLSPRGAFDRVAAMAKGRIFEPFEAFDHVSAEGTLGLYGSGAAVFPNEIKSKGDNNYVFTGYGAAAPDQLLITGSNNVVFIGAFCDVATTRFTIIGSGCTIFVGAMTTVANAKITAQGTDTTVEIGERCFIGEDAVIYNSDGHGIYSVSTRQRINVERDILVGDHVYVGHSARIGKGAVLESEAIILEKSVVSGVARGGCVHQGVPAVVVQEDVAWAMTFGRSANDLTVDAKAEAEFFAAQAAQVNRRLGALTPVDRRSDVG